MTLERPIGLIMDDLAERAATLLDDMELALAGGYIGSLEEEIKHDPTLDARSLIAGGILGIQILTITLLRSGHLRDNILPYVEGCARAYGEGCRQLREYGELLPFSEDATKQVIAEALQKLQGND